MAALFDRVGMTTATTGTGTLTLGSAITDATNGDYLTFSDAGVPNATVVNYLIVNGNNFELGTGTYTSSGTTLSRGATLSKTAGTKGTTAITLVGSSNVYIVPQASASNTWNGPGLTLRNTSATTGGILTIVGGAGSDTAGSVGNTWPIGVIGTDGSTYKAGIRYDGFMAGTSVGTSDNNTAAIFQSGGSNPSPPGVRVYNGGMFGWGSGGAWWNTCDLGLYRNAAGVLEINSGTTGTFATLKTGGLRVGYISKTAAYTAVIADGLISCNATTAAFQITLPTAVGADGQTYTIKKVDSSANAVTVGTTSSQTIDGSTTYALSAQWNTVTVVSNGANWLIQSKV